MRQSMEVPKQEQGLSPEEERWNNNTYRALSECSSRRHKPEGESENNENIRRSNDLWELDFRIRRLRTNLGLENEFGQKEKVLESLKKLTGSLGLEGLTIEDLVKAQDRGLIELVSEDLFWEEEYGHEEGARVAA